MKVEMTDGGKCFNSDKKNCQISILYREWNYCEKLDIDK